MDIENAALVLRDIEAGRVAVREVYTDTPSPFAFNLITQGHADILRMEERMDFINRMHQMVLAKIGMKEKVMVGDA